MAHASTPVSTALPAVGLFPLNLPADGPTIQILEMVDVNSYLIAYDEATWTRDQIDGYIRMYLGDYQLVEAPEGGA